MWVTPDMSRLRTSSHRCVHVRLIGSHLAKTTVPNDVIEGRTEVLSEMWTLV